MDYIKEAIFNHLKMKTTGALLLTGEWGCGKTYYIKNNIFPAIENETEFIPIIVSLFGETDKNNIAQKVLFAYFDKKGEKVNLSTGAIAKNLKNLSEAIPFINNYVDVNKLIIGSGDNIFKFLPHEKLLICFDDVERMSKNIEVNDFLGIINELVENKGSKVILIANEDKIENGISFKEKTVEKTIHYSPNISLIYDDIIKAYGESDFAKYLIENKDFILKTINPKIDNPEDELELQKSFSNIRTLKFALEHFKYAFEIINKKEDLANELIKNQLKSLWVFTISISVEFKKPNNISFIGRKNLDKQWVPLVDIEFSTAGYIKNEVKDNPAENEWAYSEKFMELYYNRLSETYIYFPDVYNLITSGREINEADFFSQLDNSFNIKEGIVNPAHELLNRFFRDGFWTFENDEFKGKLEELANFVESGKLDDVMSYLNAGVYLIGFIDFIDFTQEEIAAKIRSGIDKLLRNVRPTFYMATQLDMVAGHYKEQLLKDLVLYIKEKLKEVEKNNDKEEALKLEELLINDLDTFINEFVPENSGIRTPDKPIFHQFDQEKVGDAVQRWNPKSIMNLCSLFKMRYLDTGFSDRLKDEYIFLESIENGISQLPESLTLSSHVLKTQLVPRITECKERLKYAL
ncbi:MAG: KAP family NTPase [Prolixibacteraceae bacterium]|nr:KAP family NTPase [Prolixibacteraceae bacterium]